MSKLNESELQDKLRKFRNKRNYLEQRFTLENITKLNIIYKKINIIYELLDKTQTGGLIDSGFKGLKFEDKKGNLSEPEKLNPPPKSKRSKPNKPIFEDLLGIEDKKEDFSDFDTDFEDFDESPKHVEIIESEKREKKEDKIDVVPTSQIPKFQRLGSTDSDEPKKITHIEGKFDKKPKSKIIFPKEKQQSYKSDQTNKFQRLNSVDSEFPIKHVEIIDSDKRALEDKEEEQDQINAVIQKEISQAINNPEPLPTKLSIENKSLLLDLSDIDLSLSDDDSEFSELSELSKPNITSKSSESSDFPDFRRELTNSEDEILSILKNINDKENVKEDKSKKVTYKIHVKTFLDRIKNDTSDSSKKLKEYLKNILYKRNKVDSNDFKTLLKKYKLSIDTNVRETFKIPEDKAEIYSKFEPMLEYHNSDTEDKVSGEIYFKSDQDKFDILIESKDWDEFEKIFKSIFIENSLYFKEKIFNKSESLNLILLIIIIKYFLKDVSKNKQVHKLKEISIFYPELFNQKVFTNVLFGLIETDIFSKTPLLSTLSKKSSEKSVKSYDYLGKNLFNLIDIGKDGNVKNTIELAELFPEFVKDEKFCKIIDNTKSVIDVVHLLPYLEDNVCKNINWNDKLNDIINNSNISNDDKDKYLIYFFLSIPDLDKVAELLKYYRRKHYNFKLLNSLLNILNFDKRFQETIKDEKIIQLFESRVIELRKNQPLKDELWFWVLKYCITFNVNEKYYYFQILGNYFRLIPKDDKNIFQRINIKRKSKFKLEKIKVEKKDKRDLNRLFIQENMEYILKNYQNMNKKVKLPDVFEQFIVFINNNRKYFGDIFVDKKFNIKLYNLVSENANKLEGFKLKALKLTEDNLKPVIKIKFEKKMIDKLNDFEFNRQLKIINKLVDKSGVKKLRVDFYMTIKNELNNNLFRHVLFYHNIRIEPIILMSQYLEKRKDLKIEEEEKSKKNKERDEKNKDERKDFNDKTFKEKYNILESKLEDNKGRLDILEEEEEVKRIKKDLKQKKAPLAISL